MVRQLRLKRRPPSATEREIIDAQPEIDEAIGIVLAAWRDLGTCRPIGMAGAGPIPWTAIVTWADRQALDHDATELLVSVLRRLDADRAEREASRAALKRKG